MGETRVNVLELDLALDEMYPLTDPRQNDIRVAKILTHL